MPVSTERLARFDRTLSRLLGLGGIWILGYWALVEHLERQGDRLQWWLWGHGILALLFFVLIAAPPRLLTPRVLNAMWLLTPAVGVALQLTAFVAAPEKEYPPGAEVWETTWMMSGIYLCQLALRCPGPGAASMERQLVRGNLFAAVLALTPATGFWLGHHFLPPVMLVLTVVQFTNVAFVMVFVLYRSRMVAHFALQERWERRARHAAAAEARTREERAQARRVHDDVLGTLNSIALFGHDAGGALPPDLLSMASGASALLVGRSAIPQMTLNVTEARKSIVDMAESLGVPDVDIVCDAGDSASTNGISADALRAVRAAMGEAIRNSRRHAASRRVRVSGRLGSASIDVCIDDDGPGFLLDDVPVDRLGVRSSILQRMRDVPGGDAVVTSAPGRGTHVRLSWNVGSLSAGSPSVSDAPGVKA